jgi:hypothetical protein
MSHRDLQGERQPLADPFPWHRAIENYQDAHLLEAFGKLEILSWVVF